MTPTDEELTQWRKDIQNTLTTRPSDADLLRLIAALRASREDLRIANEAGLALLATAAELAREVERLQKEAKGG